MDCVEFNTTWRRLAYVYVTIGMQTIHYTAIDWSFCYHLPRDKLHLKITWCLSQMIHPVTGNGLTELLCNLQTTCQMAKSVSSYVFHPLVLHEFVLCLSSTFSNVELYCSGIYLDVCLLFTWYFPIWDNVTISILQSSHFMICINF